MEQIIEIHAIWFEKYQQNTLQKKLRMDHCIHQVLVQHKQFYSKRQVKNWLVDKKILFLQHGDWHPIFAATAPSNPCVLKLSIEELSLLPSHISQYIETDESFNQPQQKASKKKSVYWKRVEAHALSIKPDHYQLSLEILYQDDDLIIVNKPEGILSVPSIDPKRMSMYHIILSHLYHTQKYHQHTHVQDIQKIPYVRPIHRLDLRTSGILCFSLHPEINSKMTKIFQNHQLHKVYWAISKPISHNSRDTTNLFRSTSTFDLKDLIEQLTQNSRSYSSDHEKQKIFEDPFKQNTVYEIKTRLRACKKDQLSTIQKWETSKIGGVYAHTSLIHQWTVQNLYCFSLLLHTGRTHQLRVHLQSIGYPILGDPLYANDTEDTTKITDNAVMYLHAVYVSFKHPRSGQCLCLSAPLPKNWIHLMASQ